MRARWSGRTRSRHDCGRNGALLVVDNQAPDPLAALRRNEERYHGETCSGGLDEDIPTIET